MAYTHFYGNQKGLQIYKLMRAKNFVTPSVSWKRSTKIKKFVELILRYCNNSRVAVPPDIYGFLCTAVTVNDTKETMQKKMAKKYGSKAAHLHKILKSFYTSIAEIH